MEGSPERQRQEPWVLQVFFYVNFLQSLLITFSDEKITCFWHICRHMCACAWMGMCVAVRGQLLCISPVDVCVCMGIYVAVRGQLSRVSSLLHHMGLWIDLDRLGGKNFTHWVSSSDQDLIFKKPKTWLITFVCACTYYNTWKSEGNLEDCSSFLNHCPLHLHPQVLMMSKFLSYKIRGNLKRISKFPLPYLSIQQHLHYTLHPLLCQLCLLTAVTTHGDLTLDSIKFSNIKRLCFWYNCISTMMQNLASPLRCALSLRCK